MLTPMACHALFPDIWGDWPTGRSIAVAENLCWLKSSLPSEVFFRVNTKPPAFCNGQSWLFTRSCSDIPVFLNGLCSTRNHSRNCSPGLPKTRNLSQVYLHLYPLRDQMPAPLATPLVPPSVTLDIHSLYTRGLTP